jgi:hypothetical protein
MQCMADSCDALELAPAAALRASANGRSSRRQPRTGAQADAHSLSDAVPPRPSHKSMAVHQQSVFP